MATHEVNRVYSADQKLWVGMTTDDAKKDKKIIDLFDFADKNGNGEIDEDEITRYNGPILKTPYDSEYYEGLRRDQVHYCDKAGFDALDVAPKDNVLSKNEIEIGFKKQEIELLKRETAIKLDKIKENKWRKEKEGDDKAFFAGLFSGAVGTIGSMLLQETKWAQRKFPSLALGGARASVFIGSCAAIIGAGIGALVKRHNMKQIEKQEAGINARYKQQCDEITESIRKLGETP